MRPRLTHHSALIALLTLAFLSWPSPAPAQQGGAALRLGTAVTLDFAGHARVDAPGTSRDGKADLSVAPGFALHLDHRLLRHLDLGALFRTSFWKAEDYRDARAALFDVAPRATGHYDYRDFRFYASGAAGLTVSAALRDHAANHGEPRFGAMISLSAGLEYWFLDRVGVFAQSGFTGHYVRDRAPNGDEARLRLHQAQLHVGATFALSEPAQGRPRRDVAADDRRARRQFGFGKEAFDHQRYERALGSFRKAYSLSPRPLLLYNIAKTEDALGKLDDARGHYLVFVAAVPASALRGDIERRIAQIEADRGLPPTQLSSVEAAHIAMSAEAAVDGRSAAAVRAIERPVTKTWWFWTALGTVVAATAVTGVMVAN